MTRKPTPDEERARESQRVLERVSRESETIATSSLARVAKQATDHISGADADQDDKAELWGKRVGRSMGIVAAVVLLVMLINWLLR
ncbi:MAG: hypothetical protein WA921_08690 [Ahrensia sp.]